MKAVIRGKLIGETTHVKRVKLESYKKYTEKLRELEQEHQNTNDPKAYQQIRTFKMKINDLLLDEVEKKSKFLKQNY